VKRSGRRRIEPLVPHLEDVRSVKLIGLGGVGGIVARYLAGFLAGASEPVRMLLIDGDEFEPRNASRMLFSACGNKAAVVRDDLLGLVESDSLTIAAVEEYVNADNLTRLIARGDVVLLCVDNHATRKLVSDHCRGLRDVCLISGGNDGIGQDGSGRSQRGTFGNVQIHRRRDGQNDTPPIDAFHPEIESPVDAAPGDVSCTEAVLSVPQLLFTNLATASALLNAFFLYACRELGYPELCFDIAEGLMRPVPLPWRAPKPAPGEKPARVEPNVPPRPVSPASGEMG
jgi:adenylyltransferase/sulfurtransferase